MPPWAAGIWRGRVRARAGRGTRIACLLAGAVGLVSCAGADRTVRPSPSASQMRQAIRRGVAFLAREQRPSGAFPVFLRYELPAESPAASSPGAPADWKPDSCTQGAAYVLYSLQFVRDARAAAMARKAAAFLLREMEPPGVWRYYASDHMLHRKWALDIEDTVLAGLALLAHEVAFPHEITILRRAQTPDGGFRLWLFGPDEPPSREAVARNPLLRLPAEWYPRYALADDATNSLVLGYFARHNQPLPALCAQLVERVRCGTDDFSAAVEHYHYPTVHLFPYAVGRAYRAGARCLQPALAPLADRLRAAQRQDGSWGSISDTALALAALLDVGEAGPVVERGLTFLLAQQQADGGWPFQDTQRMPLGERTAVYGSRAIVTGVVLEGLEKYLAGPASR